MLLTLDDKFRVVTDSSHQNFILERFDEIENRKTKEVRSDWVTVGYFGTNLNSLLKRYKNEVLINSDVTSLHDVLDKLTEIDSVIDKRVKKENIRLDVKDE